MGLISRVSSRTYRKNQITSNTTTNMSVNVRTRQYMSNALLNRKQMIVDISHGEAATPSCKSIQAALAKMYKSTADCVIVYGMQTKFGGGNTTGFAHIYDSSTTSRRTRCDSARCAPATPRRSRRRLDSSESSSRTVRPSSAVPPATRSAPARSKHAEHDDYLFVLHMCFQLIFS